MNNYLRAWHATANIYQWSLLGLGAVGVVSALFITGFTENIGSFYTKVFAFISAASFGLITGLNIGQLASGHRNAWRHLNVACMKFNELESFKEEDLIQAYNEAETLIGHIVVNKASK